MDFSVKDFFMSVKNPGWGVSLKYNAVPFVCGEDNARRTTRPGAAGATAGFAAVALDSRLAPAIGRRRLTLAVSNPDGDVQREYRRNGYAKVKSYQTSLYFGSWPGFWLIHAANQTSRSVC
jgi:hypothetical protein